MKERMGWGGEALLLFYDTLWAWGECIALVSYNDSTFGAVAQIWRI